jgi:glycerol-3-phosphate acyltransferase PlsX
MITVALDAMGGDLGTAAVVGGVSHYLSSSCDSAVLFRLFGKRDVIEKELAWYKNIDPSRIIVVDVAEIVSPEMKPSVAVRHGKGTSMFAAIESVANQEADAVVSSGNTGAYMALSKLVLKMIDGIERPALVGLLPNLIGKSVFLDLGANVECSSENLIQFAIMGDAVAKVLLQLKNPTISLLNVGIEKTKGTEALKCAANFLEKDDRLNFQGFVEGSDLASGKSNVIVTDGFSGNIALKTIEGTIRYLATMLKREVSRSLCGKVAFAFGLNIAKNVRNSIDPMNHNGALLVGLDGIAVKSHGNSDSAGFSNAISVAVEFIRKNLVSDIKVEMQLLERGLNERNNI